MAKERRRRRFSSGWWDGEWHEDSFEETGWRAHGLIHEIL